ncbi:MAG: DUF3810 domain-containing protein [Bacteroidota bacterium]
MANQRSLHPILLALPLLPILCVYGFSQFPDFIENEYAQNIYPAISALLRKITNLLPFSLGDLLYLLTGIYILLQIVRLIRNLRNKQIDKAEKLKPLIRLWLLLSGMYIAFYLLWGLNYYRQGVAQQMQLINQTYSQQELQELCDEITVSMTQLRTDPAFEQNLHTELPSMLRDATSAYQKLSIKFPFLQAHDFSLKPSWYSDLGNYGGFLGYYNPFTGEGQINTDCPSILKPFIACHELAHQLGYASESEANFMGFLATEHSENISLQYSGQLEIFLYATGKLRVADSNAVKQYFEKLHPFIKKDLKDYRNYLRKHETVFLEWTNDFYDFFLKSNNQQTGINSYRDVVGWVIAYRKQYGIR